MGLLIGNKTYANSSPGSNSYTVGHSQNVGAGSMLLVTIVMSSSVNFSGCTYGGSAMTLVLNSFYSSLSQRVVSFYILNPSTGSNNVVASFTGNQWNNVSMSAISFTGAGGIGNSKNKGGMTSPNSQSLTISENSVIVATGLSNTSQSSGYDIAGSTRTNLFSHNTNKVVETAISETGLSAGSKNVTTKADYNWITNYRVEVLESVSSTPTSFLGIQAETSPYVESKFLGVQAETSPYTEAKFLGVQAETSPFYDVKHHGVSVEFNIGEIAFKGLSVEFNSNELTFKGLSVEYEYLESGFAQIIRKK